jgi:hypothetical protein
MPKFFTHKLNLLERTKLLEGILCQSISFTNSLSIDYTLAQTEVIPTQIFDNIFNDDITSILTDLKSQLLKTPLPVRDLIDLPSPRDIYNLILATGNLTGYTLLSYIGDAVTGDTYYTSISIQKDNNAPVVVNGTDSRQNTRISNVNNITYSLILKEGTTTLFIKINYLIYGIENNYPTKPNTITSAVNRILDLAEPLFSNETPRFTFNPVQAEKWENTAIPDTTITQATLREQVQHIANFVHAQVRLGGWYNGEYQENMIFFDEYGQEEESTLQGKPYVANQIKHSINDYCTQIDTNAQNIVNSLDYGDGVVLSPDAENFKTVRTETINARLSESNCIIETEAKIYDVISVKVKAYKPDGTVVTVNGKSEWEIEPFVFEQHAYNNLSSYGGGYPYSKSYALCYQQGQKNISGLFFKATTEAGAIFGEYIVSYTIVDVLQSVAPNYNWKDYVTDNFPYLSFQVSYIPVFETKYSHTKGYMIGQERKLPFTKIYNQSENTIEARLYGQNIKGVAERLGNKEATRTYYLGSINKVPKTGTKLDDYYISSVVTEYMQQSIRCTVGLTEKFNRLSQNVGINSTKRVYEVSEKQAYDRNILLKEYICIGDNTNLPLKNSRLQKNVKSTLQTLRGVITGETQEKLLAVSQLAFLSKTRSVLSRVKAPLVSSAFGNVITYSWKMKDNFSAGAKIEKFENGFWQTDVAYGDYYGRAYYMQLQLTDTITSDNNLAGAMTSNTRVEYKASSPISTFIDETATTPYLVRKDSREILNFNLAIEYITNRQDLIIGSALASCNPCVSNSKLNADGDIIVPNVYVFDHKINKYAKTIDQTAVAVSTPLSVGNTIYVPLPQNTQFDAWAIAYEPTIKTMTVYNEDTGENEEINITEGGEILIACNNGSDYYADKGNYTENLYVRAYSDKLKEYESV